MTGPSIDEICAALDTYAPHRRHLVGPLSGDRWWSLADVVADARLVTSWYATVVAGPAAGRPDVAGAYLASWLADAVVGPVALAVVTMRAGWPVAAERTWLRRHPDGWIDAVAVDPPVVWWDLDESALDVAVADAVVAPLAALFGHVRDCAPFGLRGMWGQVADRIVAGALAAARADRRSAEAAWERAMRLVDAVTCTAGVDLARPALRLLESSDGVAGFPIRGTCCLWYKTQPDPDPDGDGYCVTCPHRTDTSARTRLFAYLETERARP